MLFRKAIARLNARRTVDLVRYLDAALPDTSHENKVAVLDALWRHLAGYLREDARFQHDAYVTSERYLVHVIPWNFYSPIATVDEVKTAAGKPLFGDDFGVHLDRDKQLDFFRDNIVPFLPELSDVPIANASGFFWSNGLLPALDAAVYYGLIRSFRPKQILEVGSGFSTRLAVRAVAANGDGAITCIEPFPVESYNENLKNERGFKLIESPVQTVDLDTFKRLEPGDILFIDSSHVAKPGSDFEHLLFRIFPLIRSGVLVHIHDIFLPNGYNEDNYTIKHRHWNENYLVAAYLAGNSAWDILIGNAFIWRAPEIAAAWASVFSGNPQLRNYNEVYGCSLWLRRR